MRMPRLTGTPSSMPESTCIVIECQSCLVASLIAVNTHQRPSRLTDKEWEFICHLLTFHQSAGSTVSRHHAGIIMHNRRSVLLVFSTVDAVIYSAVLGRCGHLDISVTLTLTAYGLADRHSDTCLHSSIVTSSQRHDKESESGIGSFQFIFIHHVRTAAGITQTACCSIE